MVCRLLLLFCLHRIQIKANSASDDVKIWDRVVPYIVLSRAMNNTRILSVASEELSNFQRYFHKCHESYR